MENNPGWFSEKTFITLFKQGMVVDGRAGGLVVGRSHTAGNVYMLQEIEESKYAVAGSLEGGEYILNHYAHLNNPERIEEINKEKCEETPIEYILNSEHIRIINTKAAPHDKFLFIDRGQFIVNARSTAKYLNELDFINGSVNAYSVCDLYSLEQNNGT